jgi:hypothetical protein
MLPSLQREFDQLVAITEGKVQVSNLAFHSSLWGRLNRGLIAAFALFIFWALLLPVIQSPVDAVQAIILMSVGVPSACLGAYSLCFAAAPSLRYTCSSTQLIYRGLFRSIAIPWGQVESFKMSESLGLFSLCFLVVRAPSIRRRPFRFNATGIRPSSFSLNMVVLHMVGEAKRASDPEELAFEQDLAALKEGKLDAATMARIDARMKARTERMKELIARASGQASR